MNKYVSKKRNALYPDWHSALWFRLSLFYLFSNKLNPNDLIINHHENQGNN